MTENQTTPPQDVHMRKTLLTALGTVAFFFAVPIACTERFPLDPAISSTEAKVVQTSLSPASVLTQSATNGLEIAINWSPADPTGMAELYATLYNFSGGQPSTEFSATVAAIDGIYVWTIPSGTLPAGDYRIDVFARFRAAGVPAGQGTISTWASGGSTPFATLY